MGQNAPAPELERLLLLEESHALSAEAHWGRGKPGLQMCGFPGEPGLLPSTAHSFAATEKARLPSSRAVLHPQSP